MALHRIRGRCILNSYSLTPFINRKTPCDTLSLGQADARREKTAQNQKPVTKIRPFLMFA